MPWIGSKNVLELKDKVRKLTSFCPLNLNNVERATSCLNYFGTSVMMCNHVRDRLVASSPNEHAACSSSLSSSFPSRRMKEEQLGD